MAASKERTMGKTPIQMVASGTMINVGVAMDATMYDHTPEQYRICRNEAYGLECQYCISASAEHNNSGFAEQCIYTSCCAVNSTTEQRAL